MVGLECFMLPGLYSNTWMLGPRMIIVLVSPWLLQALYLCSSVLMCFRKVANPGCF